MLSDDFGASKRGSSRLEPHSVWRRNLLDVCMESSFQESSGFKVAAAGHYMCTAAFEMASGISTTTWTAKRFPTQNPHFRLFLCSNKTVW